MKSGYHRTCAGFSRRLSIGLLIVAFGFIYLAKVQGQEKSATISLSFTTDDSLKYISASVHEIDKDSIGPPVTGMDVYFYVDRLFRPLPIAADEFNITDDQGIVTVEFPVDLPGDTNGIVTIIARIEDDPQYGNLEARGTVRWGKPLVINLARQERALWASRANAPVSLLILVNSIILVVWVVIFYIVYQVYRIRKAG